MRQHLDRLATELHGELDDGHARQVIGDNLHLTLSFLGWVEDDTFSALSNWLAHFVPPSFTLTLDRIEHFGTADVVWAGPSSTPGALIDLVAAIDARAAESGISVDRSRPYRPHVSLVRKVPKSLSRSIRHPIVWPVDQCVLMRASDTADGARYETAARSRRN